MTDNKKTTDGTAEGQLNLQDPEMSLKPEVSIDLVPGLISKLYGLKPRDVKELPSYDDRNYFFNADVYGTNSFARADGYVMKILNTLQSSQPAVVEANLAFQQYLRDRGISTQVPVPNKDGKEFSLERITVRESDAYVEKGPYIVWVVTFLPGDTFVSTPYVPGSFYNVGKFIGRFHQAAKGFHHPFYDTHKHIWSLTEVPALSDFLYAVKDPDNLAVVKEVMAAFQTEVKPKFSTFTKGVIHGDINDQNIIMVEVPGQDETTRDSRIHDVSGILDFADVTSSFNVLELAVSIAYLSIECPDEGQAEVGGHVLAGYSQILKLNEDEIQCLKTLVCCRLCQTLVFGAHTFSQQPWNPYVLTTSARGWPLLHKLWKIKSDDLVNNWKSTMAQY